MIYSRIALAAFVAAVNVAGSVQAAGLLPDLPPTVMVQNPNPVIVQAPDPDDDHSAEIPLPGGGDSGGGDTPKPISIKKTRNLPTPGNPGGGSDGDLPLGENVVEEDRDYALVCEITPSGALRFANAGSETMPSGIKIRWKAGAQRGAFRLNIDLEPGATAAAPDMFEDDSVYSCWAAAV